MSQTFEFTYSGAEELTKALEKAIKQYPYTAERVLKKETRVVRKGLKQAVQAEISGHHSPVPGNLAGSFSIGRVMRSGNKMTCAVTQKAPHYHLYELGHEIYTHQPEHRDTGLRAVAKKTVARYMAKRSEHSEELAEETLELILKEAGLE